MKLVKKKSAGVKPKMDWLIGQWQVSGDQIGVLFIIEKNADRLNVKAVDQSDGEELVVSKVKWFGKSLSFETKTLSNAWRTKNRFSAISKTQGTQELTYWQPWEKVSPTPVRKSADT